MDTLISTLPDEGDTSGYLSAPIVAVGSLSSAALRHTIPLPLLSVIGPPPSPLPRRWSWTRLGAATSAGRFYCFPESSVCHTTYHVYVFATEVLCLSPRRTQDSLSPLITPRDRCALEYLTDVRYVRGPAGMVVEFHFAPNPYFTNKVSCTASAVEAFQPSYYCATFKEGARH